MEQEAYISLFDAFKTGSGRVAKGLIDLNEVALITQKEKVYEQ
jgi:hypothetical protein